MATAKEGRKDWQKDEIEFLSFATENEDTCIPEARPGLGPGRVFITMAMTRRGRYAQLCKNPLMNFLFKTWGSTRDRIPERMEIQTDRQFESLYGLSLLIFHGQYTWISSSLLSSPACISLTPYIRPTSTLCLSVEIPGQIRTEVEESSLPTNIVWFVVVIYLSLTFISQRCSGSCSCRPTRHRQSV